MSLPPQGETDGSSFQNGGLRATHTAAAYTVIDPSSPIVLRDDTIYIPTVLAAFTGEALEPWGDAPRVNRLVFIGRNLDRDALLASFESCLDETQA